MDIKTCIPIKEDLCTKQVTFKNADGTVLISSYSVNQYKGTDLITAYKLDEKGKPDSSFGLTIKEVNDKDLSSWEKGDEIIEV